MFYVTGSNGVVITNITREGVTTGDPVLVDDTGTIADGTGLNLNYYVLGTPVLFGSGNYPPYPYIEPGEPVDSDFKCGCKNTECLTSHWQIQGVLSTHYEEPDPDPDPEPDPTLANPYETGGQCASSQVPAAAAAQGLTYLAFCDDFSTPSINVDADWQSVPDPATSRERWSTYIGFGKTSTHMSGASLKWDSANGWVTIDPDWELYQLYMSSRGRTGGGYEVDKKTRWYAEVRWRFDKKDPAHQPAFWSMDSCHSYGEGGCPSDGVYVEPDFWEYSNATVSVHFWKLVNGAQTKWTRCPKSLGTYGVSLGEWFTVGHLYTGGNTSAAQQRYYKNNSLIYTRTTSTGGCTDFGGGTTAKYLERMGRGNYPIFLGSKPNDVITYDYVRVWEHPDDQ
jgi:hypothetical protein